MLTPLVMGSFYLLPLRRTKVQHVHNITRLLLRSLPIRLKAPHLKTSFLVDLRITRILFLHLATMESPPVTNLPILHRGSCHVVLFAVTLQHPPPTTNRHPCPSVAPHVNPGEVAKSISVLATVPLPTTQNLRCQAPRSQARKVGPVQKPRANELRRANLMKKGMAPAGRGNRNLAVPGGKCYQVRDMTFLCVFGSPTKASFR